MPVQNLHVLEEKVQWGHIKHSLRDPTTAERPLFCLARSFKFLRHIFKSGLLEVDLTLEMCF